jgi:hypothetical protein
MLAWFWTFAQATTATLSCLIAERARFSSFTEVVVPPAEPPPLSRDQRWERATAAMSAAISSFGRIETLQASAASQIDAADYTLQHLLEELSIAIPTPADGSALRALLATVAEREEPAAKTLAA